MSDFPKDRTSLSLANDVTAGKNMKLCIAGGVEKCQGKEQFIFDKRQKSYSSSYIKSPATPPLPVSKSCLTGTEKVRTILACSAILSVGGFMGFFSSPFPRL